MNYLCICFISLLWFIDGVVNNQHFSQINQSLPLAQKETRVNPFTLLDQIQGQERE